MLEIMLGAVVLLAVAIVVLAAMILAKVGRFRMDALGDFLSAGLKDVVAGGAKANSDAVRQEAQGTRQELQTALAQTRSELSTVIERLRQSSFDSQTDFQKNVQQRLDRYSEVLNSTSDRIAISQQESRRELVATMNNRLELVQRATVESGEKQVSALSEVRTRITDTVSTGLKEIQEHNERKLEQMRQTVDERLQATLDKKISESFEIVTRQLIDVQKGLSEMQTLAQDVGGLKKALTNIKVRGMLGEAQLGALLEQFLTRDQYMENIAVNPRSAERVEFAVKLPGVIEDEPLWLPIDSKFPIEDYQRLQEAYEKGDKLSFETAGRAFESRLYLHANDISSKYIVPPHTTDFALLFLPFESVYAEAIRRPGLFQDMQRKYHVTIVGPTTLAAFLNSLQVGFKTLAITKQSAEVWKVLGAVKTEFKKFGDVVSMVQRNLDNASSNLSKVSDRAKQMEKKLGKVSELPSEEVAKLLPAGEAAETSAEAEDAG